MFRTITAKFPGTCKRCGSPIVAGETIRYGGYGRTYHFADKCNQSNDKAIADQNEVYRRSGGAAGRSVDESAFDEPTLVGTKDDIAPANVTIIGTKDNRVVPVEKKKAAPNSLAGRF